MNRRLLAGSFVLTLALAVPSLAAVPEAFLTGPSKAAPHDVLRAYLQASGFARGWTAADLANLRITDEYTDAYNGVTHVYLRQSHDGLEVVNANFNGHVDRQGRLFTADGAFVPNLAAAVRATAPAISAEAALLAGVAELGPYNTESLQLVEAQGGRDASAVFSAPGLSLDPIPVHLAYYRVSDNDVRLVWDAVVRVPSGDHWWNLWIDATTGRLVAKSDWISEATYRVYPIPTEAPSFGPRALLTDPNDLVASPFGWHDTNGVVGAEFTTTQGNNVHACTDTDANNVCDPGSSPDGGALLAFDFPIDLTMQPSTYRPAVVTNLFYMNNIMHDISYHYGFNEVAGNFQVNNYGHGGLGNDPVQGDAQDGSGTNNANFATPADGSPPRMQMYLWNGPILIHINTPPAIAGDYQADPAGFGASSFNLTNDIVLAVDSGDSNPNDGCCNDSNNVCPANTFPAVNGKIGILNRGTCEFGTKVLNMQNSGAVGAIVVNNQGDGILAMGAGANGGSVTIPSVFVGQTDGTSFIAHLPANVTMNSANSPPLRDGDIDNGVMAHEYGHGISNRLTGGPSNVNCLSNAEEGGEGWSDWQALYIFALPGDTDTTNRGVGTYVAFQATNGVGIRQWPYTTNMSVNPSTYDTIKTNGEVHAIGTVWATMLWEMYWQITNQYGWQSNLYAGGFDTGVTSGFHVGGNNVAYQLVSDGMKLQVCSPGFVDARNAILSADQADYHNDHVCLIWQAFAKRGLGLSANEGSSNSTSDGTQAFDVPATCTGFIFANGFEIGSTEAWTLTTP